MLALKNGSTTIDTKGQTIRQLKIEHLNQLEGQAIKAGKTQLYPPLGLENDHIILSKLKWHEIAIKIFNLWQNFNLRCIIFAIVNNFYVDGR